MWLYTTTTKHTIIILFPRNRRVSPIYHTVFFRTLFLLFTSLCVRFCRFYLLNSTFISLPDSFYWIGFKNSSKIYSFSSVCLSFTHSIFVVCLWLGSLILTFFLCHRQKKWATQSPFLLICSPFAVATVHTYVWIFFFGASFVFLSLKLWKNNYSTYILVDLFDWSLWIHFGFDFTLPCHLIISPFIEYFFYEMILSAKTWLVCATIDKQLWFCI